MIVSSNTPGKPTTYSWQMMMFISMNYIIGMGLLNLPHSFAEASLAVSLVVIVLTSFSSTYFAIFLSDALAHGFALKRAGFDHSRYLAHRRQTKEGHEAAPLLHHGRHEDSVDDTHPTAASQNPTPDYSIPNDELFEMPALMRLYFGRGGYVLYQFCIIFHLLCDNWGSTTVVASSLASVIPMKTLPSFTADPDIHWKCGDPCGVSYSKYCNEAYFIWMAITLVCGQALVFFDLSKQKVVQTIFTFCRFFVVSAVGIICLFALFIGPFDDDSLQTKPPYISSFVSMFHIDAYSFGRIFGSATFSQIVHHSCPNIIQFLRQDDTKKIVMTWYITFMLNLGLTFLSCIPSGLFFGTVGTNLVTLNFAYWDGVAWSNESMDLRPWWAIGLSYALRVLPPCWVISFIPLNGITLSSNILTIFPPRLRTNKWINIGVKIFVMTPPILLGGFVRCLSDIIEFSGLAAYVIIISCGLMMLRGTRMAAMAFGEEHKYSSLIGRRLNNVPLVSVLTAFNIVGFIFTAYSLCLPLVHS